MNENFTPEALIAKTDSPPVVFTKMCLLIDRYGENVVYCFVEGYDMPYYYYPVKLTLQKEPIGIECGGKDNVINANKYIESKVEYTKYIKRYFVDRDYTDNTKVPDSVCVTEGYAIENYYLSDNCVRKILKNEFKIDEIDNPEIFSRCISFYHDQHKKFEEAVLLFNAWYCCLHENSTWDHTCVSLDDKFPSDWMDCRINSFLCNYSLLDIQKKYAKAPLLDQNLIESKKNELRDGGWYYMRGKYELQFLYTFLKFLHDEPKKNRVYTVHSCKIPFNQKSMISTFCQYADVPESLLHYIKNGIFVSQFD